MRSHQRVLCRGVLGREDSAALAASAQTLMGARGGDLGVRGGRGLAPPPDCSVKEGANKEVLGILVSYRVKVKLVVARGG